MFDAPAPTRLACRHCGRRVASRPRGLCFRCYYSPGIRGFYPTESRFGQRGVGNGNLSRPAPVPTAARPGSAEKLAVLEERAAAGVALWHPLDAAL